MMKTVVIANPHACNGRVGRKWADYARGISKVFGPMECCHTTAPGEMTVLVRQAIHAGTKRIVVVGGDGSVNEAVNGFFENDQPNDSNENNANCNNYFFHIFRELRLP